MRRRSRTLPASVALLACSVFTRPMLAQSVQLGAAGDTVEYARATLQRWDEQLRLMLFDRGGSYYGRTSDRGFLQRFNELADNEYELDLISYGFSMVENYDWYRRGQGVRYWGGSINKLRMIQEAEFAASVDLGSSWVAEARFTHQATLQAERSALRFGARKGFADGRWDLFGTVFLSPRKPESDVELGAVLRPSGESRITVAVAALDLFNDLIYETLGVGVGVSDTALHYTSQPLSVRIGADTKLGPIRVEVYALALTPTALVVQRQTELADGFTQDERFAYAGGLVEWEPSTRASLGGFATWVRARTGRSPLELGEPEQAFDLTEKTSQLGVYGIRLFNRFVLEGWVSRMWRTEDRLRPDTTVAPSVNYEDRAWLGHAQLTYRGPSGLRLGGAFEMTAREVVGDDRMPGLQDRDKTNARFRVEVGWAFGRRAMLMAGAGLELDSDIEAKSEGMFDGGHARLALFF